MSSRKELANAIRALSMDAVQKAKSGHPGAPMGMADIAEVLWRDFLNHNPTNPSWADRDRFVLSNGHGSMLIYSLLHLTGYDLPMSELQNFRQLHSKTPGHPEVGYTAGVETTTGPLGQGIANAVGMAIAEKTLAAQFNRPGHDIVDHFTYAFLGDGIANLDGSGFSCYEVITGGGEDDTLRAGSGGSILWGGGASSDALVCGSGSDDIYYGLDDGSDTLYGASAADRVLLYDMRLADVAALSLDARGAVITTRSGGSLLLAGQTAGASSPTFCLADGSWQWDGAHQAWQQR